MEAFAARVGGRIPALRLGGIQAATAEALSTRWPEEAARIRRAVYDEQADAAVAAWSDAAIAPLYDVRIGPDTPRTAAALTRLRDLHTTHGIDAAWLPSEPTLLPDLVHRGLFGSCLTPIGLHPHAREALARALASGTAPAVVVDHRLGAGVLHELSHGPQRAWHGAPAPWMLLEAAAAWVGWRCEPRHLHPDRPGDAVPGQLPFLRLSEVVRRARGERALVQLALAGDGTDHVLGERAETIFLAAELRAWGDHRALPYGPDNRDVPAWERLIDAALGEQPPPWLDDEAALTIAGHTPWSSLPSWRRAWDPSERAAVARGIAAMFQVIRSRPEARAEGDELPDGRLHLDVEACSLRAATRTTGLYAEPATWTLPPSGCRRLWERGARTIRLRGVRRVDRERVTEHLIDLVEGSGPLDSVLDVDLSAPRRSVSVAVPDLTRPLGYAGAVLSLGSCFAVEVAERLASVGFSVVPSPFGLLYDPLSLARALTLLASDGPLPSTLLVHDRHRWHSLAHHDAFSGPDAAAVADGIARPLAAGRAALRDASTLLLTLGTSVVMTDRATGEVAAHTHHLDPARFDRRRLGVDEVVASLSASIHAVRRVRPGLPVILTVSPVRHLGLGAADNHRSKAVLLLAAEAIAGLPDVTLFPAYEIVLDELRDHAWYLSDGAHVTPAAADVVFSRFVQTCLSADARPEVERRLGIAARIRQLPADPLARRDALDDLAADLRSPPLDAAARPDAAKIVWVETEREQLAWLPGGVARPPRVVATAVATAPDAEAPTSSPNEPAIAAPTEPPAVAPPAAHDLITDLNAALGTGWVSEEAGHDWAARILAAAAPLAGLDEGAAATVAEALLPLIAVRVGDLADPGVADPVHSLLVSALLHGPPSSAAVESLIDAWSRGQVAIPGPELRAAPAAWDTALRHRIRQGGRERGPDQARFRALAGRLGVSLLGDASS